MIPIARRILQTLLNLALFAVALACSAVLVYTGMSRFYQSAYPTGYQTLVERESARNDLSPALVYAVIRTESGFRPGVQSSAAARGLMQITKPTFEWAQYRVGEKEPLHFDDLYDSELNIRYGTIILRLLLNEVDTVENALCAYHAGLTQTQEWLKNPAYSPDGVHITHIPFDDTRYYVGRVLDTIATYETLYDLG